MYTKILGLLLTIVGSCLMYFNSLKNEWKIDGGKADTDFSKIEKDCELKNKHQTVGLIMTIIGSLILFFVDC